MKIHVAKFGTATTMILLLVGVTLPTTVLLLVGLLNVGKAPNLAKRDLVAPLGFEPRTTAPEAAVLPLHYRAI